MNDRSLHISRWHNAYRNTNPSDKTPQEFRKCTRDPLLKEQHNQERLHKNNKETREDGSR